MQQIGSLRPFLKWKNTRYSLSLSTFKNVLHAPLGQMFEKKLFLFQMASLNRVLLGTRYYMNMTAWWSWTYHTCHRRTRWPCYVLLSPFWRTFLKGERKGVGGYFFEKFNRWRWDLIFFMVGALIWHVWNTKSQSAVFFCC